MRFEPDSPHSTEQAPAREGEPDPQGEPSRFLYESAGRDGYTGRCVDVGGRRLLSFASYDYVGLARCHDVIEGAVDAIRRHGTQFPFPRVHLESELLEELRLLLERMTGAHAVIAPSTTLAHMAALPALLESGDVAILDAAAHPSLDAALTLTRAVPRASLASGELTALAEQLERFAAQYRRVWYLVDGIDPLTGRLADLETLSVLLERFPSLHLYIDDAHATSWLGEHGRGHALGRLAGRDRVVATLSLNKAFGAAGAAILFADAELARRVGRSPGLLLSGAVPPPMLGAAIASARLHLTAQLETRQCLLRERIRWVVDAALRGEVRLADTSESPIFFVRCGDHARALRFESSLREADLYAGAIVPPLVRSEDAGVRFMVSVHNEQADVERLLSVLARPGSYTPAG
jgi:7-keto-8-aminopelargonate synthetase-like enzyme